MHDSSTTQYSCQSHTEFTIKVVAINFCCSVDRSAEVQSNIEGNVELAHSDSIVEELALESQSFNLQGRPIIISCKGDVELEKRAFRCLQVPQTVDCLQGILTVIPLQLLSFHIAVLRGYDVSTDILSTTTHTPLVK